MGKTANSRVIQQTEDDTFFMEGKPQKIVAKEAGRSECCSARIFMESWVEEETEKKPQQI